MNVLGVEFDAKKLNYVLLVGDAGEFAVAQSNRLEITETRTRESLRAFQNAVTTLLNVTKPDVIAIKDKPESGQMRAGAAALKMEGILLAAAACEVEFVSGKRINACETGEGLKAYHQPAYKAAMASVRKQVG
ncbi:MAG: DUF3010 family protein [Mesorhizobium sp.]|uniref:DUF3010 family protein n=1 Tax=Mesorhizobium sp. TaxID=1871066 RepID=UPI000FE83F7E|nr:DUF3010 family protein [Mesorhizobium sp.]RWG54801.1 MAG: DUF3010 family protein [Mesorhizobium sp.]RWH35552.1 MAG: DUF3010 family protein [Mesorhizobium sp.]RWI21636.1 MAG: DUF3010 family protein [Mesorhizobium sp.]WIE89351.1 DUF3010 family protein [Mesorhizobium sp. WSM4875]